MKTSTFLDFLIFYNNLDVKPFVEAIQKMKKYNSEKGVDVFKDAISVPGIARKLLFETSENNNTPFTPKALSPGVERQILGVKISARVIQLWRAHCERLDAAFKIQNALV